MAELYEIPVRADVLHYRYRIRMDNVSYYLGFRFNRRMTRWIMDIMDTDENMLVAGVPLLLGVNLLGRYRDSRLPAGTLFVMNIKDQYQECGQDDFGSTVILLYQEAG